MAKEWSFRAQTRLIRLTLTALVCLIVGFVWFTARRSQRMDEQRLLAVSSPTPQSNNSPDYTAPPDASSPDASTGAQAAASASNATPPAAPSATPLAVASSPSPTVALAPTPQQSAAISLDAKSLLVPVAGVRPDQLQDTFTAARSEGRVHDAIDIPAARNTPVLACADGRILKLFQSVRGGTTIYQLDPDNKTVYYYAHLDHYADGVAEDRFVHRGDVIGYVGDTGNAGAGNYHLHFSISLISDPKHFYNGTNINPYPLLSRRATP